MYDHSNEDSGELIEYLRRNPSINIQPSTSRSSQYIMEKFLKGKTLYIEEGSDGHTLHIYRFVIANIIRCENGVIAKSEENGQMFISQPYFDDLKKQGWHIQHHYCGNGGEHVSMTFASLEF